MLSFLFRKSSSVPEAAPAPVCTLPDLAMIPLEAFAKILQNPANKEALLIGPCEPHTWLTWLAYQMPEDVEARIGQFIETFLVDADYWRRLCFDRDARTKRSAADWALGSLLDELRPLNLERLTASLFMLETRGGSFVTAENYEKLLQRFFESTLASALDKLKAAVRACPGLIKELKTKRYDGEGRVSLADAMMLTGVPSVFRNDMVAYLVSCGFAVDFTRCDTSMIALNDSWFAVFLKAYTAQEPSALSTVDKLRSYLERHLYARKLEQLAAVTAVDFRGPSRGK